MNQNMLYIDHIPSGVSCCRKEPVTNSNSTPHAELSKILDGITCLTSGLSGIPEIEIRMHLLIAPEVLPLIASSKKVN